MGQAQINVRTRACSRTSIARTRQAALTHNVRGKELKQVSVSDATGRGCTAHVQIHVRLNKSGAHIAVVRFLNHVVV